MRAKQVTYRMLELFAALLMWGAVTTSRFIRLERGWYSRTCYRS